MQLIGVQPEPGSFLYPSPDRTERSCPFDRCGNAGPPTGRTALRACSSVSARTTATCLCFHLGEHHAPHTLIAGSTGSGKSVHMQNIILSIAATNRPDQARIILVDPKQGVDYFLR